MPDLARESEAGSTQESLHDAPGRAAALGATGWACGRHRAPAHLGDRPAAPHLVLGLSFLSLDNPDPLPFNWLHANSVETEFMCHEVETA